MHRKFLAIVAFALVITPAAYAQNDPPGVEFFAGYTNLQSEGLPNRNTPGWLFDTGFFRSRSTQHGVNVSVSGFATNWFSLTGDVSFARQSETAANGTGGQDTSRTDTYYFLGGPTWKVRSGSRVEPFARVMAGAAHTRFRAATTTPVGGGTSTSSFRVGSTDFAAAVGGGLDVRLTDRAKLRLIQIDYAPVFLRDRTVDVLGNTGVLQPTDLEGQRQDNVRFSIGFVF
jgi:opacity protein-like surface antigen